MGIATVLSKLGKGLVSKGKSVGKLVGKSILDAGTNLVTSTSDSVSELMFGETSQTPSKLINELKKSDQPSVDESKSKPQFINESEVPVFNPSNPESGPSTVVSFKNIPPINLNSDKAEAISEFIRHNRAIENILEKDIKLREKLGRDRLGLDIREQRLVEDLRKKQSDRVDRQIEESRRAKEEEDRERRSREERLRSMGRLEVESELNKAAESESQMTESIDKKSESDFSLDGSLTSGIPPLTSSSSKFKSIWDKLKNSAKNTSSKVLTKLKGGTSKLIKSVAGNRGLKAAKFLANPKALGKLGKKMLSKILPAIPKLAKRLGLKLAKTGVKGALKQVPILGIILGIGEAISDISEGDYTGAALSALAGIAPTLNLIAPGLGTAISLGAISADMARDVFDEHMKKAVDEFDKSDPESIMKDADVDLSNTIPDFDMSDSGSYNYGQLGNSSISSPMSGYSNEFQSFIPSPIKPKPATYRKSQLDNQVKAMQYLINDGLSPEAASGIVGCLMAESGLNPHIFNKLEKEGRFPGSKANGPGYGAGLAQWSLGRKESVLDYLKSSHQPTVGDGTKIEDYGLDAQMDAILNEIHSRPKLNESLRKPGITVSEATDLALRGFENGGPRGFVSKNQIDKYTWDGGYIGAMYGKNYGGAGYGRVNFANDALNNYTANSSGRLNATPINVSTSNLASAKVTPTRSIPEPPKLPNEQSLVGNSNPTNLGEPTIVKGGDYAPIVNGGTTNVTIINTKSNDDLKVEIFG